MEPIKILVTGADSQLGKTLKELTHLSAFDFTFTDIKTMDICERKSVNRNFRAKHYDYCFNFAAYTDVNGAERDRKKCYEVNVKAVEHLALVCKKYHTTLVHISTDFVFNGQQNTPYTETDETYPVNYYGQSKLLGEKAIEKHLAKYFIIRTSWLYSKYNNNFLKTISRLAQTDQSLKIVSDQIGTPTYAVDLIDFILRLAIRRRNRGNYGLYHYSNSGSASWYDFGMEIIKHLGIDKSIIPVSTDAFPTPAKRPAYSVLSKQKAIERFAIQPRDWRVALEAYFNKL